MKHVPAASYVLRVGLLIGVCLHAFLGPRIYPLLLMDEEEVNYPITLVTAYYPLLQGSKHSLDEYMAWASNFYNHTQTPIVAYLPPTNISGVIKTMRGDLPLLVKVKCIRLLVVYTTAANSSYLIACRRKSMLPIELLTYKLLHTTPDHGLLGYPTCD